MNPHPAPEDPRRSEETEEYRFGLLNDYWEALQRGETIDPDRWAQTHPTDRERLEDLRLVTTLHDALQMVRQDSRIEPSPQPGAAVSLPVTPAGEAANLPQVVGGYRRLRRLGGGGMGEVFEAEDCSTGLRVALKLLAPHFDATDDNVERFRREGRLASTITHPRCVFVLAADEEAGQPYIVMELMPGDTLKELVERQGPLPPEQAVRTILDVIDGLQAAHRLQVLHRDVKPSNCFLDTDGRVKVGDFGLSKSLTGDASLTQAGTFLGTVHYAAPEQFKGPAAVDLRCDVYAAAATLYYLLTGQPPFADVNPATVVARKASEPAPPLRGLRPNISPALEQVVLRGLERDRDRRWRDLGEFRQALLPFLPGHLSVGGLGMRVGAFLIDLTLLSLLGTVAKTFLLPAGMDPDSGFAVLCCDLIPMAAYFAVLEGWWGCSLGKRLLRLRVRPARGSDSPSLPRVLLRTLIFLAIMSPSSLLSPSWEEEDMGTLGLWFGLWLASIPLEVLVLAMTMRARNGYRGLHEFLSGTRVVQLPWPERRPSFTCSAAPLAPLPVQPDTLPGRVGPFGIGGALCWEPGERILLGEDEALRRQVWIRLGPESTADPIRREVRRPTRLRWLGGGRHADGCWDAFLAPAGCPLVDLFAEGKPLPWREARPILEQLTDELTAAEGDGTLPRCLTVAQVWVQADGRVQLLDIPLGRHATEVPWTAENQAEAALSLLRQVAVLTLEGRYRSPDEVCGPVRAPLPLHASRLLNRLLGVTSPHMTVAQVQTELAAAHPQPAEVTPDRRAAHVAVLGAFLFVGLACMFFASRLWSIVWLEALNEQILEADAWLRILDDEGFRKDLVAADEPFRKTVVTAGEIEPVDLPAIRQEIKEELETIKRERDLRRPFLRYTLGLVTGFSGADATEAALRNQTVEIKRIQGDDFTVAVTRHDGGGEKTEQYDLGEVRVVPLNLSQLIMRAGMRDAIRSWRIIVSIIVGAFPTVWVLWAFLSRGGFSLRMMGVALVRSNGRKALRIQCAWRALLVWVPVTALLLGSSWLDQQYWSEEQWEGAAWLALASWWLALALLLAYFLLAFWRPTRSLHDRLAGTYLVPR